MGNAFPLILLSFFGIVSTTNHGHNDVLVAVGNQIDLLTNERSGQSQLNLGSFNASMLMALVHDPTSQELFFSDRKNKNGHIFSVRLDENLSSNSSSSVQLVIEKGSNESVEGLTYDPVDKFLFWTDGLNQSIRRLRIARDRVSSTVGENISAEVVHFLGGDRPRGLVCDPCTRMLYWTNWNMERPTIERSRLDGTQRDIIVSKDLLMPHGLGLDIAEQKIYWANNLRLSSFQIERSFVDGSNRELVYHGKSHEGKGQFIYGLTVGEDFIYWTDWDSKTLFSFPKDGSANEPTALRQYAHKPMAVAIFQHQPISCDALLSSSTAEQAKLTTIADRDETDGTSVTVPIIYPQIESVCYGYCLNGGQCYFVNDELNCSCPEGFNGDRCELSTNINTTNNVENEMSYSKLFIALISLSATSIILMITVIILSFYVWKLSRQVRPRLKRRKLARLSNKMNQQLPTPSSGERVINIEDCCNMNICETPCMEPPSTTSSRTPVTDGNKGKTGDRLKLLNFEF